MERPNSLETLLPELHLQILSHLPISSHITLKLTSKTLYNVLPLPPAPTLALLLKNLPSCERLVLRRSLYESRDRAKGKRWCIICSMLQRSNFFCEETVPVCRWHESWLMKARIPEKALGAGLRRKLEAYDGGEDSSRDHGRRTIDELRQGGGVESIRMPGVEDAVASYPASDEGRVLDNADSTSGSRWIRLQRQLCAQCLHIRYWDLSPASHGETSRSCRCACRSCGVFNVDCYVRLNGRECLDYPRTWEWPRWEKGQDGKERCVVLELHRGRRRVGSPLLNEESNSTELYCKRVPVVDFDGL